MVVVAATGSNPCNENISSYQRLLPFAVVVQNTGIISSNIISYLLEIIPASVAVTIIFPVLISVSFEPVAECTALVLLEVGWRTDSKGGLEQKRRVPIGITLNSSFKSKFQILFVSFLNTNTFTFFFSF
jgi:hypothetical protein